MVDQVDLDNIKTMIINALRRELASIEQKIPRDPAVDLSFIKSEMNVHDVRLADIEARLRKIEAMLKTDKATG